MTDTVEQRLETAGWALPGLPPAKGLYRTAVRHGELVHLSAHGPFDRSGGFTHIGAVGGSLDVEAGRSAAQSCALSLLASAKGEVGSLDQVGEVLTMRGYVNAPAGFTEHAAVLDGASEVFLVAFGERGRAARTAVGVASLPFDLPIVVEASLTVVGPA